MELTPTGVNNPGMRPHNEPPKSAHTWLKCLLVDRWQRDLGSRSLTGSAVLAVAFENRAPHGWRTLRTAEFQVVRKHDEYRAAACLQGSSKFWIACSFRKEQTENF